MLDSRQDGDLPVDADATKPQPESHRPSRTIAFRAPLARAGRAAGQRRIAMFCIRTIEG
jgi:hypothetical protein